MNIMRVINIATVGWRSAVPPAERIELLGQVETWVKEQRAIAEEQMRFGGGGPADFCPGFGPNVHRARGPVR